MVILSKLYFMHNHCSAKALKKKKKEKQKALRQKNENHRTKKTITSQSFFVVCLC